MSFFIKKLQEVFGFYYVNGTLTNIGVYDWPIIIDISISLVISGLIIYFLRKSIKNYFSYKGSTPDLYMMTTCFIALLMISFRLWIDVTFQAYQYMSIMYCICHMLILYYFSLMILYTPSIIDSKKYKQITRIFTIVFMAAIVIYLYSSIEFQSAPTSNPRDRHNIIQSSIEPILQLDCLSLKSFIPNLLIFGYSIVLCFIMIIHLRKTKMNKVHKISYYFFILIHILICFNAISKIFYMNYADLRQGRMLPIESMKDGPIVINSIVFQILLKISHLENDLSAPVSYFIGMHNVILTYVYRIIYVVGFMINAQIIMDNKNIRKLEEKQIKKLRKYRDITNKLKEQI